MMILLLIIAAVAAVSAVVICVVVLRRRKSFRKKCIKAADTILREEFLNYSLRNPASYNNEREPRSKKMMICLSSDCSDKKKSFVYDPEFTIELGRDKSRSNVYICDETVARKQCCVYSRNDIVYLYDYGNSNPTVIKRGLFSKIVTQPEVPVRLLDRDYIVIGSAGFRVSLFYFDSIID